jgi:hypothetical protein
VHAPLPGEQQAPQPPTSVDEPPSGTTRTLRSIKLPRSDSSLKAHTAPGTVERFEDRSPTQAAPETPPQAAQAEQRVVEGVAAAHSACLLGADRRSHGHKRTTTAWNFCASVIVPNDNFDTPHST